MAKPKGQDPDRQNSGFKTRVDKIDDGLRVQSTWPLGRLRVLVTGSYMAVQCTANQEPLDKFGIVPKAVRDSTYFLSPKLPLALRKSSSIKGHANA